MASVMCLHFSMQEESILEYVDAMYHFVHTFSELVDQCATYTYTSNHY
jgi:hypothetical protein